jgi:non-homologous end joining protein Ku
MTRDVDMSSYQDEYRKAVLELVVAKQEGRTIETPLAPKAAIPDVVDALLASLKAVGVGV